MRTHFFALSALAFGAAACVPKSQYAELENQYKAEQAKYVECAHELEAREAIAKKALEEYQALMEELKPLIDRKAVVVEVVDGRVVLNLAADVLFASGSDVVQEAAKPDLREIAHVLAKRSDADFQVEGHTDDDDIATEQFPSNWFLGSARAINVVDILIRNGMDPSHISAATYSMYQPITNNKGAENKARNRRIEIVVLPDMSVMPGYDQLMEKGRSRHAPRTDQKGKKGGKK